MKEIFKTKTKAELSKEEFPGLTLEELKLIILERNSKSSRDVEE